MTPEWLLSPMLDSQLHFCCDRWGTDPGDGPLPDGRLLGRLLVSLLTNFCWLYCCAFQSGQQLCKTSIVSSKPCLYCQSSQCR